MTTQDKEKSCNLSGQQKIMQPLGTTKNHATSQDKKNHTTSWDKKDHANLSGQKSSCNLSGKNKSRNLSGQKIMPPLGTK